MGVDRREFLKIAGLSAVLGMAAERSICALAAEPGFVAEPEALKAERWAMVVDLNKCKANEGCRDCMNACHRTHNVPKVDTPRHEVKWIWTESYEHAFPTQENEFIPEELEHNPVLVFCNHCSNPPCVRVCPTKATWKREDGIVMMDWHRCIGCRYCVAACPYGSRSFNYQDPRTFLKTNEMNREFPTRTKGVVEKCTFCDERLAKGLPPACVEACKEGCLVFGDLEDSQSEVRQLLRTRFSVRRKPGLGTQPEVYYIV
ncbi:MAG: sulfate reduction electron transfer complex DsrMKJOP subunit DsrO [bacterium]